MVIIQLSFYPKTSCSLPYRAKVVYRRLLLLLSALRGS